MHPRTLFRLLLRWLGVYLFVYALMGLLPLVAMWVADTDSMDNIDAYWTVGSVTGYAIQMAAALYLFFRPGWIVDAAFTVSDPGCPHCGRKLRSEVAQCPECGAALSTGATDEKGADRSPNT